MLHSASLAEARLLHGEVDGAVEAAHRALDLSTSVRSHRAAERFTSLLSRFSDADAIAAREVIDRIASEVPQG